jgi:NAD(P)-dependent dehydrogenase (short-subunit alcohol dehydrogenase family)
MNGRICLVTGATQGIGRASAEALAARGERVLVHGRDLARAQAVAAAITQRTGNREVRAVQADFAELAQVRRLAHDLNASLPRLEVLINNAGRLSSTRGLSADGYELTFAVNHLAPFLLTNLLLPKLRTSAPARVIIVASEVHRRAQLDFDDLMNDRVSGLMPAYARSKLANMLFARALTHRLTGSGITVNALHPGIVASNLFHNAPAPVRLALGSVLRPFVRSVRYGARTSVYLATAPELLGKSGGYYRNCRLSRPGHAAQNDADAARLWQESARLTGLSV